MISRNMDDIDRYLDGRELHDFKEEYALKIVDNLTKVLKDMPQAEVCPSSG